MKWFKRLLLVVGVLVLLVIGGVALFVATFNPNAYKGQIEALVKEKTGRTLTLAGNMQLAIYPWLGLRLNNVSLSNPPGFGKQPFARVGQVSLYVEILPLLQRRLVVDKVVVDGLDLALERNANGIGNWVGIGGSATSSRSLPSNAASLKKAESNPAAAAAGAPFVLSVAGLDVRNARVTWTDLVSGSRTVLAPLNLSVGKLGPGQAAPLALNFHIENVKPAVGIDVNLTAQLSVDLNQGSYALKNIAFNVDAKANSLPKGEVKSSLTGDLSVSTSKGGELQFAPFKLMVNDTQADGSLKLTDFVHPAIQFTLHSPAINLDHLMATMASASGKPATSPNTQSTANTSSGNIPIPLPIATLRTLTLNGQVAIDHLIVQKLHINAFKATIKAQNGVLQLAPATASLYDGNLKANVTVDVRGATPRYAADASMQKVQLGNLLKDYAGDAYITGLAKFNANLASSGDTINALTQGLGGQMALAVTNGSIQHSKLADNIQTLMATLQKTKPGTSNSTQFASLTGTAKVTSGIIENNDLLLDAVKFKATGSGTANLVKRRVDYVLTFAKAQGTGLVIPLKINGPFNALGYNIDLSSMVQQATKQKVQQQINKQRQKLQQELQNSLKKLF